MKKMLMLLLASLLFFVEIASSQIYQPVSPTQFGANNLRTSTWVTLSFPTGCGKPSVLVSPNDTSHAAIFFDSCNNIYYVFNPHIDTWDTVGGTPGSVGWGLMGNHITAPYAFGNNYLGTNNNYPLYFAFDSLEAGRITDSAISMGVNVFAAVDGIGNAIYGTAITGLGTYNTLIGTQAGNGLKGSSYSNTVVGYNALQVSRIGSAGNGTHLTVLGDNIQFDNFGPYTYSIGLGACDIGNPLITASNTFFVSPHITEGLSMPGLTGTCAGCALIDATGSGLYTPQLPTAGSGWSLAGNAGTGETGVLGTTDNSKFSLVVDNYPLGEFLTTGEINLGDGKANFGSGNSGLSTNGTNLTTVGDWNSNLNAMVAQIDDNAQTIFLGSLNNSTSNFTINNSTGVLQYFSNDPYMLLDGVNRIFEFGDLTYDWYGSGIAINDGSSNQSIAIKANNQITLTGASGGATLVGVGTSTPQATLNVVGTPQFDVNLSDYPQGHNLYMTDSSHYVYEADGDWKYDINGTFGALSDSAQTISWNQQGGYSIPGGTSMIYNYGAGFPFLGFYNKTPLLGSTNPQDLRWYGTSTTNYSGLHGILSPTSIYDATIPAAYAINGVWKDVAGDGVLVEGISFHASFSATEAAATTITVTLPQTMPNNTYAVFPSPTSLLAATPWYITNKTTTTFDITYTTAVTGSLTFDYLISQY